MARTALSVLVVLALLLALTSPAIAQLDDEFCEGSGCSLSNHCCNCQLEWPNVDVRHWIVLVDRSGTGKSASFSISNQVSHHYVVKDSDKVGRWRAEFGAWIGRQCWKNDYFQKEQPVCSINGTVSVSYSFDGPYRGSWRSATESFGANSSSWVSLWDKYSGPYYVDVSLNTEMKSSATLTASGILYVRNGEIAPIFATGIGYWQESSAPPPQQYTLTVYVRKLDGSPVPYAKVQVGSTVYTADSLGKVSLQLQQGTYSVGIPTVYFNCSTKDTSNMATVFNARFHWGRYVFDRWGDGSTSNPRSVSLNGNVQLTAYVRDEYRLWVLYEPYIDGSETWGVVAVALPGYTGQRLPYNLTVWLRPGSFVQLQAVEGGGAWFVKWTYGSECYPRNDYSLDPLIGLTMGSRGLAVRAVFKLAPSNRTLFAPGEQLPNPMFWCVYEEAMGWGNRRGTKGTWRVSVTALTSQAKSANGSDSRLWIWAWLMHPNRTSAWVPLTGTWELSMSKNWSAGAHKHELCDPSNPYTEACKILDLTNLGDYPVVAKPQQYAGWYLIGLAAWKPLWPNEPLYRQAAVNTVWLSNGTTLAVYNVTFIHVNAAPNGNLTYWQPVAVSTFSLSALARYSLGGYDDSLARRPIYAQIEATVSWKYLPHASLVWSGFRASPPREVGVLLELDGAAAVWAPYGTRLSDTASLYVLALGDTEEFYRLKLAYRSRNARLSVRWYSGFLEPNPGTQVKLADVLDFTLAPSTPIIVDIQWSSDKSYAVVTVDWDCFRDGSKPMSGGNVYGYRYRADLTVEWGPMDPSTGWTLPPAKSQVNTGVVPPTLVTDSWPDYWIAFYALPAGGSHPVTSGSVVPIPLYAKYPPRARP